MAAIEKFARIFGTTVPAFFIREKPTSRKRKPTCMNMTSTAATTTQVVSIAGMASLRVGSMTRNGPRVARIRHAPGVQDSPCGFVPVAKTASRRSGHARCLRNNSIAAQRARPLLAQLLSEGPDLRPRTARELARVHAEEAVRVAGGGPDALVAHQGLVEQHWEVVPEGR